MVTHGHPCPITRASPEHWDSPEHRGPVYETRSRGRVNTPDGIFLIHRVETPITPRA
jgi:hypothetical protein